MEVDEILRNDCLSFFRTHHVEKVATTSPWGEFLKAHGFEVNPAPVEGEVFDAAVAVLTLDRVPPRETFMGIERLANEVHTSGLLYAVFHPYDPEVPNSYKDNQLKRMFPQFRILEIRSYPQGYRGFLLKKLPNNGTL